MTYKEFAINSAAIELPNKQWRLEGTITPAGGAGVGELFESQNQYPSKETAEQHFMEFAKRYIDGTATRADLDQRPA